MDNVKIIAIVGMMTKMAEVTMAVAYRKKSESGEYYGGPMHYMKDGLDSSIDSWLKESLDNLTVVNLDKRLILKLTLKTNNKK